MGKMIINYPNAKALRIYNALIEHFHVDRNVWDETLGDNRPRTDAELKWEVDNEVREWLKGRIKAIEHRDAVHAAEAAEEAGFVDPGMTDGAP